jgi:predicted dehydrogenase
MLAGGPETELAGVWSRTPRHAQELAARHAVPAFATFEELLERVDAVAFAVVPGAQPELASTATAAGKPVLLEKPVAFDVAGAERVADATARNHVGSLLFLTYRFAPVVRDFVATMRDVRPQHVRARFVSGSLLEGPFVNEWRRGHGAVMDVGPHLFDLVEAVLGPVTALEARGDPLGTVWVECEHASGGTSELEISCTRRVEVGVTDLVVETPTGPRRLDARAGDHAARLAIARREFVRACRDGHHELDAARGVHLQQLIADVSARLG